MASSLGLVVVSVGTLAGLWLGQTHLGASLPRVLALATLLASLLAVGWAVIWPQAARPRGGEIGFTVLCLGVSALVLGSAISVPAVWQVSPMDHLAGFLPYSDAAAYYQQVLEWPAPTFNPINSRRPLSTALNLLAFDLGGSTLLGMLLVHAALAALGITAFMAALAEVAGRWAALTAGGALLLWTWPYAGTPLSEINSITLSAAGYALLLVALARRERGRAALGVAALIMAYAIRPYNPLMPALMAGAVSLGLARHWRPALTRALAVAALALLGGVVLSAALGFAYGHPQGSANSNAAYTALGLARGTDWKEASNWLAAQHPGLSERAGASLMYTTAVAAIRQDPRPLCTALGVGLVKGLYFSQQEVGAAVGLSRHAVGAAQTGGRAFLHFILAHPSIWLGAMFAALSGGALFAARKRFPAVAILGGVSVLGLLSAAPVFFGDGSWRAVAALYPGLALLVAAIPLAMRSRGVQVREEPPSTGLAQSPARALPFALLGFAGLALLYPASFRLAPEQARPWAEALVLEIRQHATPHWLGPNRAVVAPGDLQTWATAMGQVEWAAFVARHAAQLVEVRFEGGGYSLLMHAAEDLPGPAELPQDPLFKVRSAASAGG